MLVCAGPRVSCSSTAASTIRRRVSSCASARFFSSYFRFRAICVIIVQDCAVKYARRNPMAQVDHIVDGIYRISTPPDGTGAPITFNQFLIDDEAPVLVHTGNYEEYGGIHKAIS